MEEFKIKCKYCQTEKIIGNNYASFLVKLGTRNDKIKCEKCKKFYPWNDFQPIKK